MEREERAAVARRFTANFGHLPAETLAGILGEGEARPDIRTLDRIFRGQTIPQTALAQAMARVLDSPGTYFLEAQLIQIGEEARARHEAYLRQFAITWLVDGREKVIPAWFALARRRMDEGHYQSVLDIIDSRRTPDDWPKVPDEIKPYVLLELGLAAYKLGMMPEARNHYCEALELIKGRNDCALLTAALSSNLGLALARLSEFREGAAAAERAAELMPERWNFIFNYLCVLSLAGVESDMTFALGRATAWAELRLDADSLHSLVDGLKHDPDLTWARRLDIFNAMLWRLTHAEKCTEMGPVKGTENGMIGVAGPDGRG